jgi:hypothetical protein
MQAEGHARRRSLRKASVTISRQHSGAPTATPGERPVAQFVLAGEISAARIVLFACLCDDAKKQAQVAEIS